MAAAQGETVWFVVFGHLPEDPIAHSQDAALWALVNQVPKRCLKMVTLFIQSL